MNQNDSNTSAEATGAEQQQGSEQAAGADAGSTSTTETGGEQAGTTETGTGTGNADGEQQGEGKADAEPAATDAAAATAAEFANRVNDVSTLADSRVSEIKDQITDQSTTTIEHGGDKAVVYFGPIQLQLVESSQILAIGHHAETNTLAIRFKDEGERLYHYANVDAELFDRFRNAESVGSFFYKEIRPNKDRFPYFRIREEVAAQAA